MITAPAPLFTERDHAILVGLARQAGLHTATYCQQLHDKLRRAVVITLDQVEPDLATFGSFVRYRVDGGRPMPSDTAASSSWICMICAARRMILVVISGAMAAGRGTKARPGRRRRFPVVVCERA